MPFAAGDLFLFAGVLSPRLRNLRALEVLDLWDNFLDGEALVL